MKHLLSLCLLLLLFFLGGCNSCNNEERKYDVMTRYGGWKARADETRSKVESISTALPNLIRYEFDSLDREVFDSEFPYWQEIHVFLGEGGIQHARLFPDPSKSRTTEVFYFSKGKLIFAAIDTNGFGRSLSPEQDRNTVFHRGEQYFFIRETLVLALDEKGERRDIADDKVKIKGVDLLYESEQIKKIIADKKIKL